MQRLAILGSLAADPRVLSAEHHRHQCLPRADARPLHCQSRPPPDRNGNRNATEIRDAVERRHVDLRGGRAQSSDHGVVGSRWRRDGGRCRRPRWAHSQSRHLRHGRHVVRRRADPRRRAGDREPRQDRRPRHRSADDGHQHRERRRRHHCAREQCRHARGRPAKRGRGPGTSLLWPRRRMADGDRLQPRARLSLGR